MKAKKLNLRAPKISTIVVAALYILLGVCLMLRPETSLTTLCYLLGGVTLLLGIIKIIGYFSKNLYCLAFQFDLVMGILAVIFGLLLLFHPRFITAILPFVVGVFVLLGGLLAIQSARDSRAFGLSNWWVLLLLAILSVVLGAVLMFKPFGSAVVIMSVIGVSLIFTGVEKLIVVILTIYKGKKKNAPGDDGAIEVDFKDVDK